MAPTTLCIEGHRGIAQRLARDVLPGGHALAGCNARQLNETLDERSLGGLNLKVRAQEATSRRSLGVRNLPHIRRQAVYSAVVLVDADPRSKTSREQLRHLRRYLTQAHDCHEMGDRGIIGLPAAVASRDRDISIAVNATRQIREQRFVVHGIHYTKLQQLGAVTGIPLGAGSHGGDWDAWPADLRIREFPADAEQVPA